MRVGQWRDGRTVLKVRRWKEKVNDFSISSGANDISEDGMVKRERERESKGANWYEGRCF